MPSLVCLSKLPNLDKRSFRQRPLCRTMPRHRNPSSQVDRWHQSKDTLHARVALDSSRRIDKFDFEPLQQCRYNDVFIRRFAKVILSYKCSLSRLWERPARKDETQQNEFRRWYLCNTMLTWVCSKTRDEQRLLDGVSSRSPAYRGCTADDLLKLLLYVGGIRELSLPQVGHAV